jgi:hypothetical protein
LPVLAGISAVAIDTSSVTITTGCTRTYNTSGVFTNVFHGFRHDGFNRGGRTTCRNVLLFGETRWTARIDWKLYDHGVGENAIHPHVDMWCI